MKRLIVKLVSIITLNKVRGQRPMHSQPSLKWWWTPWTYKYQHGGWIYLSREWFKRFTPSDQSITPSAMNQVLRGSQIAIGRDLQ